MIFMFDVTRFFEQSTGDDKVIGTGKQRILFNVEDTSGKILGIIFSTTLRDVRMVVKWDKRESIEFPSNTELNTMGLNQAAGYTRGAFKIQEFYSTSPYGFACEFPIEFRESLEITIHNEGSSSATIAPFWVWWIEKVSE